MFSAFTAAVADAARGGEPAQAASANTTLTIKTGQDLQVTATPPFRVVDARSMPRKHAFPVNRSRVCLTVRDTWTPFGVARSLSLAGDGVSGCAQGPISSHHGGFFSIPP